MGDGETWCVQSHPKSVESYSIHSEKEKHLCNPNTRLKTEPSFFLQTAKCLKQKQTAHTHARKHARATAHQQVIFGRRERVLARRGRRLGEQRRLCARRPRLPRHRDRVTATTAASGSRGKWRRLLKRFSARWGKKSLHCLPTQSEGLRME